MIDFDNQMKYEECMLPTLNALRDKALSVKEIDALLASHFGLSEEDKQQRYPGRNIRIYTDRTNWARVYLKKAGLIYSPKRKIYQITEAGKKVLAENPARIDKKFLMQFESFREFIKRSTKSANKNKLQTKEDAPLTAAELTPEDSLEEAFAQINSQLADEVLDNILAINEFEFERLVLDLLKAIGYGVSGSITGTPKSNDGGIDGIIYEDTFGFNKIFIQIKRYNPKNNVQKPELQAFVGAISGKGGKGLFVTSSDFSVGAKEYAQSQNLVLLNGHELANLMIKNNFGVTPIKTYSIKKIDSDLFESYKDE